MMRECLTCGAPFKGWRKSQLWCGTTCCGLWRQWTSEQDFLAQLILLTPSRDCITYWGSIHRTGYGIVGFRGRRWLAHRAAYEVWHGGLRADLDVMHACDNPPCINPQHLRMGTAAENMADAAAKGRMHRAAGELSPRAKLAAVDVLEIRKSPDSVCALARRFGVNPGTISCIKQGKTWSRVQ